jgi:AcrR family transcriptional regulator
MVRRLAPVVLRGSIRRNRFLAKVKSRRPRASAKSDEIAPPNLLAREHLATPPRQARSRGKRDALLKAGLELFARDGYERAGIGEISKRAGVAIGTFYQQFRSKRQLLLVLMNELLQKLNSIDMQPQAGSIREAIETVMRAGLATDLAYAGAYRAWREAILSDRELDGLDKKIRGWTRGRLAAVLNAMSSLPNARREIDTGLFASVMDRLFWELLGVGIDDSEAMVKLLTHVMYHSMLADAPES